MTLNLGQIKDNGSDKKYVYLHEQGHKFLFGHLVLVVNVSKMCVIQQSLITQHELLILITINTLVYCGCFN